MASSTVIGLDIGSTHVGAAEIAFGSGGPWGKTPGTLQRYATVPLPLGAVRDGEVEQVDVVSGAIRELWTKGSFSRKEVVLGVGNQRVVVRELDLPWLPLPQIRASLPFQVQDSLPMPIEEALLDYFPTGEYEATSGRTVRGMLVAAARDTVRANILAAESAGLQPVMVDLNAFALQRSLAQGDLLNRTTAFVEIGAKISNVIIAVEGVPRFIRTLQVGGQDATEAVASALGITAAEAEVAKREIGVGYQVAPHLAAAGDALGEVTRHLVESIRNTLVYFGTNNPGSAVEVVVLTGGGAMLPGFGQYLASASRLSITLGEPLARVRLGKNVDRAAVEAESWHLALPIGLAHGVAA